MNKSCCHWLIVISTVWASIVAPTYAEEFEMRSIGVSEEYADVLRESLAARAYQQRIVFTENGLFILAADSLYRIGRDESVERNRITDCYQLIKWHDKILCVGINTLSSFNPRTQETMAHNLPNLESVSAKDDAVVTAQRLDDHLIISIFNRAFEKEESFTTAIRARRVEVIDRKNRQYLALQDGGIGHHQQRVILCKNDEIIKDLTDGLSTPKFMGMTAGGTVVVSGSLDDVPTIIAYDLTGTEQGRRAFPRGRVAPPALWFGEQHFLFMFDDPSLTPGFSGLWLLSDTLELVRDLTENCQRAVLISASRKRMIAGKGDQLVGFETATGTKIWEKKFRVPVPDGTLIFSGNVLLGGHDYLARMWRTGGSHPAPSIPSVFLTFRSYETGEVTQIKTLTDAKYQLVSNESGVVVYAPDQPLHFITPVR